MISTNENESGSGNVSRPESFVQDNSFRQQKMIKQFAQTLIFIVLIFVASFFRDTIKQERIRKKERAELAAQIARQNYLLEQERFAEKHREFLSTFLEYEDHCNQIHAIVHKNPGVFEKVNPHYCINNRKHCKSGNHRKLPVRIQRGDRTPLDFALIYVFLASLMFLFVRAIIDVSKEFNASHNDEDSHERTSTSLHAYASSSTTTSHTTSSRRPSSNTTPIQKRHSKFARVSITSTSDQQPILTESNEAISKSNETSAIETTPIKTGNIIDRRSSVPATMAHHLLKGNSILFFIFF